MNPEEFHKELETKKHFTKLTSTGISDNLENVFEFAQQYHDAKLKLLGLQNVSKCNCEIPNPNEEFIDSRIKRMCYTCYKDI